MPTWFLAAVVGLKLPAQMLRTCPLSFLLSLRQTAFILLLACDCICLQYERSRMSKDEISSRASLKVLPSEMDLDESMKVVSFDRLSLKSDARRILGKSVRPPRPPSCQHFQDFVHVVQLLAIEPIFLKNRCATC